VALLLAGAVRWVVTDTHPQTGSTLISEAAGCAWAVLILGLFAWPAAQGGSAWRSMLSGALLLGGPVTALLLHAPLVDPGGLTMALALTPVVVAVAGAALSQTPSEDVAGRLWPGLAAVAGLLLVLVTPSLGDARNDAVLVLAPVFTGAALFRAQRGPGAWRIRMALSGACLVFVLGAAAGWGIVGRPVVSVVAVAWDGVIALLSVLALTQLGATRWSAQFVLLPLLILIEGLVLARPAITPRWAVGLALLAVSSIYLLLQREQDRAPTESAAVEALADLDT
jgi:hypothetical protein